MRLFHLAFVRIGLWKIFFFSPVCGVCVEEVKTVGLGNFLRPSPANSSQEKFGKLKECILISLGCRAFNSFPAEAVLALFASRTGRDKHFVLPVCHKF